MMGFFIVLRCGSIRFTWEFSTLEYRLPHLLLHFACPVNLDKLQRRETVCAENGFESSLFGRRIERSKHSIAG